MPTTNKLIKKSDGWVEVENAVIVSNGSSDVCTFLTNPTQPTEATGGHTLNPTVGFNVADLPAEKLWFKAPSSDITLVISE